MFGRSRGSKDVAVEENPQDIITDVLGSDPKKLQEEAGPIGRAFISAVDAAVHMQTGTIRAYVHWLRRNNPDATPAEIQEIMAKHFRNTVSGTGAGAGAAAAVPGIGLLTGSAAIAGESVLFLDLAAFYTVAAAYLRGVDISDPERRRMVVLTTLMGTKGLAIVDAILGENSDTPSRNTLAKFSGPGVAEANNILTRVAMRSLNRTMRRAWLGKLLPLGLGAVAGTAANRKLANVVVTNVQDSLGTAPARFTEPLPEPQDEDADEQAAEAKLSANPKEFVAWLMQAFNRNAEDADNTEAADTGTDTADDEDTKRRRILGRGKQSAGTNEDKPKRRGKKKRNEAGTSTDSEGDAS